MRVWKYTKERMAPESLALAHEQALDALVRERLQLPQIAYQQT